MAADVHRGLADRSRAPLRIRRYRRAHLVCSGETNVDVNRDRSHDVLEWFKDTPGQDYEYLTD